MGEGTQPTVWDAPRQQYNLTNKCINNCHCYTSSLWFIGALEADRLGSKFYFLLLLTL